MTAIPKNTAPDYQKYYKGNPFTKKSVMQILVEEYGVEQILKMLTEEERQLLFYCWRVWGRPEQLSPTWEWIVWIYLAGRGSGKTRSGAEWVREQVKRGHKRIAFVAATAADYRDTMVEGDSGILAISPPWDMPDWEPSKRKVTFKNGAKCYCFSAEKPDRLRGPQFEKAWCDELAAWGRLQETWDNLMFGLRLGSNPQAMVTTTPRPLSLIKELVNDSRNAVSRGSTYDNIANLAENFFRYIIKKYQGTRLGRQEIEAVILEDNPNALFKRELIDQHRITSDQLPDLEDVVIPLDPAVTDGDKSDDTGIIPCGMATIDDMEHYYILGDYTIHGKPHEWGEMALKCYSLFHANKIVGEVNNGGDMIEHVIRTIKKNKKKGIHVSGYNVPYESVRATRGKWLRAEPISALSEQGRLHIVGSLPKLEDEMCEWQPGEKSPDRLDSMVWGITALSEGGDKIFVA